MNKKILVVYSWVSNHENGLGNVTCTVGFDVPSHENIREIEQQIREANGFVAVVVLNIIDLRES
jgi:hypothetical protein